MTPDTSPYLHAGYAVAIVVYGLYIVSLLRRSKSLGSRGARREERRESRGASREA